MDLLEISEKHKMGREEAAELLRNIADSLSRHNGLDFNREGLKFHINVPREVMVEVEVEIESGESSIEVEISW
jgi:amphi-Trp domain-containing protein